jgi:hypothetical protein
MSILRALIVVSLVIVAAQPALTLQTSEQASGPQVTYRLQTLTKGSDLLAFREDQIAILEKLNRADRDHLVRLGRVVVPDQWLPDGDVYSPLPARYESASHFPKALVVMIATQAFGAYEQGRLVRWGPVSTGARGRETQAGRVSLNWKSTGRSSTVNPDWFMPWYFNVRNEEGVAFHAYALPGRPASHGCIRLLERDAVWLFGWGDEWTLDDGRILEAGTPVLISGRYDFDAPPPWSDPATLGRRVALPEFPLDTE